MPVASFRRFYFQWLQSSYTKEVRGPILQCALTITHHELDCTEKQWLPSRAKLPMFFDLHYVYCIYLDISICLCARQLPTPLLVAPRCFYAYLAPHVLNLAVFIFLVLKY